MEISKNEISRRKKISNTLKNKYLSGELVSKKPVITEKHLDAFAIIRKKYSKKREENQRKVVMNGKLVNCSVCGKEIYRCKSQLKEKTNFFCNKNCQAKFYSGENCPSWKGGITNIRDKIESMFEYKQWRSKVFERDNWTCQTCGERGNKLNAHHIIKMSDIILKEKITNVNIAKESILLFDIDNGVTLCKECHKELHLIGDKV